MIDSFKNPDAVYGLEILEPLDIHARSEIYRGRDTADLCKRWYIPIGAAGHETLNEEDVPKYETTFEQHHKN